MQDGLSCTVIAGEQVQVCGGMGTVGNPWGTNYNRRFYGGADLSPSALAVGVTTAACTPPPKPPPGRASVRIAPPEHLELPHGRRLGPVLFRRG